MFSSELLGRCWLTKLRGFPAHSSTARHLHSALRSPPKAGPHPSPFVPRTLQCVFSHINSLHLNQMINLWRVSIIMIGSYIIQIGAKVLHHVSGVLAHLRWFLGFTPCGSDTRVSPPCAHRVEFMVQTESPAFPLPSHRGPFLPFFSEGR